MDTGFWDRVEDKLRTQGKTIHSLACYLHTDEIRLIHLRDTKGVPVKKETLELFAEYLDTSSEYLLTGDISKDSNEYALIVQKFAKLNYNQKQCICNLIDSFTK